MIGDTKYDILGARFHNIDSVGVLYGYGSSINEKCYDVMKLDFDFIIKIIKLECRTEWYSNNIRRGTRMKYVNDWDMIKKRFTAWWDGEIIDRCCASITRNPSISSMRSPSPR